MDVSDIFYFFGARGGGRVRPSRGGGEVGFSLKIPRGGRSRGAGRMSGEFFGGGGGG